MITHTCIEGYLQLKMNLGRVAGPEGPLDTAAEPFSSSTSTIACYIGARSNLASLNGDRGVSCLCAVCYILGACDSINYFISSSFETE